MDPSTQQTNVLFPGEQQVKPQTCREVPQQQQLDLANQSLRPALSRPLSTPVKVDKLQAYLDGYPFRSRQYLIDGFLFGFSIDYVGPWSNFSPGGRYLGQFLLGMCRSPLRAPTPL